MYVKLDRVKGNLVQIPIDSNSTFDMVALVTRFVTISKGNNISETDIIAISHFIIHGLSKNTRDQLVTNKLYKNKQGVDNMMSRLRKYGIVVKTNYGDRLAEDFAFYFPDIEVIKFEAIIKRSK